MVATDGALSPRAVFDALPFPAFVVDEDIKVLAVNSAARKLLGGEADTTLRLRGGEALHCINSGDGCGRSAACPDCVVRRSVGFVMANRDAIRTRAPMELIRGGQVEGLHTLLTAAPIRYDDQPRVLIVIEDLTVLLARADILPICMGCRKVRNDDLWLQIEAYLDSHLDLKLSHGICPECAQRLYPDHQSSGGA